MLHVSVGAASYSSPRIQRSYLLLLAIVLVFAAVAVTWPRVQSWRAHRHAADVVSSEHLLYGLTQVPSGLVIDETGTACHGQGDLCVQSKLDPQQTLAALFSALAARGFSFGAVDCKSRALSVFPGGGAACQATGSRRTAKVWAVTGSHHNAYWKLPTWAAVVVQDPNYISNRPPAVAAAAVDPRSVLPSGWHATQKCLANEAPPCGWFDVRLTGKAEAAIDTVSRRLEALGYGVEDPPLSSAGDMCRTSPVDATVTCSTFAFRYLAAHGQDMASVGVVLQQQSPSLVTGRVYVRS